MKIEIQEMEDEGDNATSFRLLIDGIVMTRNTGISNVCEFLMSNYGKLSQASFEGALEKFKTTEKKD